MNGVFNCLDVTAVDDIGQNNAAVELIQDEENVMIAVGTGAYIVG